MLREPLLFEQDNQHIIKYKIANISFILYHESYRLSGLPGELKKQLKMLKDSETKDIEIEKFITCPILFLRGLLDGKYIGIGQTYKYTSSYNNYLYIQFVGCDIIITSYNFFAHADNNEHGEFIPLVQELSIVGNIQPLLELGCVSGFRASEERTKNTKILLRYIKKSHVKSARK